MLSPPLAEAVVDDDAVAFAAHLAVGLGLPADAAAGLAAGQSFVAAGSPVPMRLHLGRVREVLAARLEVMLPLAAEDLVGADVSRMLTLQAAMLSEGTWWLGIDGQGLLNLSSVPCFDTPEDVHAAVDAALVVVPFVARELVMPERAS